MDAGQGGQNEEKWHKRKSLVMRLGGKPGKF